MKKILNIVLAGALLLGAASCNKQLDITKHGNMGSIEEFYKTDADAESAAAAMYLTWRNLMPNEFYIRNLMTDDFYCGGGGRGDVGTMEALNEFTHGTENGYVQSFYSDYYALIYKANLILTYLDENGSDVFKRNRAEALVARGYAHLMLGIYFGTAPVVDKILTGDDVRQPNSAEGALFKQAIDDLTAAANSGYLTEKASAADNNANNRITLGAAKSLLGKAYIFAGDKANAAKVLDEVINSGKYELVPLLDAAHSDDAEKVDWENLYHASCNNCCENILELQKRPNAATIWTEYIGNTIELMSGWRTDYITIDPTSKAWEERGGTSAYGFMNPTKSLWETFVAAGDTERRKLTLRDKDEMAAYGVTVTPGCALYGHEGYYFWRHRMKPADEIQHAEMAGYQVTQYINMKVMRYAEVLLLAAEAHDGDAKSTEYLNMVRNRANLPAIPYSLDALKTEKRMEFAGEGLRFEDLVRWGDAATVLATNCQKCPRYGYVDGSNEENVEYPEVWNKPNAGFKAGKHEHLPIPQIEREINPKMEQNKGW